MRQLIASLIMLTSFLSMAGTTAALDDISQAYSHVKPAIVKVWSFDATGIPTDSGTGFVVQSDSQQSWIVTASHVVDGASTVRIDVSRDLHDVPASIVARTSKHDDISLLLVHHGSLIPVQLAIRGASVLEGKFVATAGYFQNDDQIGASGQNPKLVGPGTVASLVENGSFIGINLNVEEGLSGAPVFDSNTGDVVGVVDVKSAVGQGGYAVSAPLIVVGFLTQHQVAVAGMPAPIAVVAIASPSPTLRPLPASTFGAVALAAPNTPKPLPLASITAATPQPSNVQTGLKAKPADINACFGRVAVNRAQEIAACTTLIALGSPNAFLYDRRCYAEQGNSTDAISDNDRAVTDCTQALRMNPSDSVAYTFRAAAYDQKGLWNLALADAGKALGLNPNYARAYVARGVAYENRGVPQDRLLALSDYNAAVRLDQNISFFVQSQTHMPFEHAAIPPTSGNPPADASAVNFGDSPLIGLWFTSYCNGSTYELYNDYTAPMYFDVFYEIVRQQIDADPAKWTKVGRIGLGPAESKRITFGQCLGPSTQHWHIWVRNIRFGTDQGPLILPSENSI